MLFRWTFLLTVVLGLTACTIDTSEQQNAARDCRNDGIGCTAGFTCRVDQDARFQCLPNARTMDFGADSALADSGDTDAGKAEAGTYDTQPPAVCDDGITNGTETDQDCGGACDPCPADSACLVASDCESGLCLNRRCLSPSCTDGIQNGEELGPDCGGECPGCADGTPCRMSADCASAFCQEGRCVAASCEDGRRNGSESDTDCGGDCAPCLDDASCARGDDCASRVCLNEVCAAPTCLDGVQNGQERDVDCAGLCEPCTAGAGCENAADCFSGVCEDAACLPPRCGDGVINAAEECDLGDTLAGDGCSDLCMRERGWRCDANGCERIEEICDDLDNDEDGNIDEWCNQDGDDFCHTDAIVVGTPATCPGGAADCCDVDPNVYPGQDSFFGSLSNCAEYDFNCDGIFERQSLEGFVNCLYPDCEIAGWQGGAPECGLNGDWITCSPGRFRCGVTEEVRTQGCR